MSNEQEINEEKRKPLDKDQLSKKEDVFFIESRILKFFKDNIGDTYKKELEEENESKRNIQRDI